MEISIKDYNKKLLKVFDTDVEKHKEVIITTISDSQKDAEIELYINKKKYKKYLIIGLLPIKAGFLNITLNFELDDNVLIFSYLDKNNEIIKHFINLNFLKTKQALLNYLPFSPLILLLPLLLFFGIRFYKHFLNNKNVTVEESMSIQKEQEESIEPEKKESFSVSSSLNDLENKEKVYTIDTLRNFIAKKTPLYFVENKSVMLEWEINKLNEIIEYLKNYSATEMLIEGHTDSIGIPNNEYKLSLERATYIKNFIKSTFSDEGFEIKIKGYGATNPVTPHSNKVDRYLNRRVEIKIITAEEKK